MLKKDSDNNKIDESKDISKEQEWINVGVLKNNSTENVSLMFYYCL